MARDEYATSDVFDRIIRLLTLQADYSRPLSDPAEVFWDDLTAANRLKVYLLSNGYEIPRTVMETLSRLTAAYDPARPEPPPQVKRPRRSDPTAPVPAAAPRREPPRARDSRP